MRVIDSAPKFCFPQSEAAQSTLEAKGFPQEPHELESFHRCWWANLASRFDIPMKGQDLLIRRRKLVKGLVQLREARIAGWNNAWNQQLSADRLGELEALRQTSRWDYFQVTLSEKHHSPVLIEQLKIMGYQVLEQPALCQYSIDLSEGLDAYLKGLSHNSRKSFKKKTRRAQELQPSLITVERAEEIDGFLEELFSHHIRYWDKKTGRSYLNDPAERQFILSWSKNLLDDGQLIMDRLLMNGETVNLSVGVRLGQSFYWLLTVNTGLYADYAPGIVGLYLRIEQFARQGGTMFNMGAGDYFYKIQSANRTTACVDLLVINPDSSKGKLYYHWLKWKQWKSSMANS